MSGPEKHPLLHEVVKDFEAIAAKLEHVIELLAEDDSGTVDLGALHRAKDAAQRGASIASSATSQVRRAFD